MPAYQVSNIWPFIMSLPGWMTQVLLVVYGQNITDSQRFIPGFGFMTLSMLLIPLFSEIGGSTGFYLVTVVLFFFIGIPSGFANAGCYKMAAAFPPE